MLWILAPGGKLRIVTPNLAKFVRLLTENPDDETQQFIVAKLRVTGWPKTAVDAAYIFNRQTHDWGHRFLYDPAVLKKSLELAGFKQITEYRVEKKRSGFSAKPKCTHAMKARISGWLTAGNRRRSKPSVKLKPLFLHDIF